MTINTNGGMSVSGRKALFETFYRKRQADFVIESAHRKDFPIKRMLLRHNITAHWYQLRRR